jgi:hypothetical protein
MSDDGEDNEAPRPVTEQDMLAAGLSREASPKAGWYWSGYWPVG